MSSLVSELNSSASRLYSWNSQGSPNSSSSVSVINLRRRAREPVSVRAIGRALRRALWLKRRHLCQSRTALGRSPFLTRSFDSSSTLLAISSTSFPLSSTLSRSAISFMSSFFRIRTPLFVSAMRSALSSFRFILSLISLGITTLPALSIVVMTSSILPLYSTTWILYLASDLLYGVVFFSLYFALRSVSRVAIAIGVALNTVFVAIDAVVDIPLRLYLVVLSSSDSGQQPGSSSSLLATAQSTIDASNLVALIATLFQFSAVIAASLVMLKSGKFRKGIAYLGVACGVVAILFVPAFALGGSQLAGIFNIGGFVLLAFWSIGAGYRLRKL